MIRLIDGGKHYRNQEWVFRHASVDFPDKRCVAVIGPTGCGKSTLIRCVLGLQGLDEGAVVDEEKLRGRLTTPVGYVPQGVHLWSYRTALENVMEGVRFGRGLSRNIAREQGDRCLKAVGLNGKASRYPHELSGGEQQRVAIARALAIEPQLLVLDEPTSGLDPLATGQIADVLRSLRQYGGAVILISHQIQLIREMADTVYFLNRGQVWEHGKVGDVLEHPSTPELQEFIETVRKGW